MATKKVSLTASGFSPSSVSCKAGDKVTFSNDTGAPATVTFDDPQPQVGSKPGPIAPGDTCDVTFGTAGTYTAHDDAHNTCTVTVS